METHVRRPEEQGAGFNSRVPYIHATLIRCNGATLESWSDPKVDMLAKLSACLSQLAYLDTIVLELQSADAPWADLVEAFIDAMHFKHEIEVRQRTCAESHKLHLAARNGSAPGGGVRPFSPFWCSKLHVEARKKW